MQKLSALTLLVVLAASLPVSAQEGCSYISGFDLGRIVQTGPNSALRYPPGYLDGDEVSACTLSWGDETGNLMQCEGYEPSNFSLVPASLENTDELTILILDNGPWYRDCAPTD